MCMRISLCRLSQSTTAVTSSPTCGRGAPSTGKCTASTCRALDGGRNLADVTVRQNQMSRISGLPSGGGVEHRSLEDDAAVSREAEHRAHALAGVGIVYGRRVRSPAVPLKPWADPRRRWHRGWRRVEPGRNRQVLRAQERGIVEFGLIARAVVAQDRYDGVPGPHLAASLIAPATFTRGGTSDTGLRLCRSWKHSWTDSASGIR